MVSLNDAVVVEEGDFHTISTGSNSKKKKKNRKRVYVGNLPHEWSPEELKRLVVERIDEQVEIQHQEEEEHDNAPSAARHDANCCGGCWITVAGLGPEQVVAQLRGVRLRGRKLVVQREPQRSTMTRGGAGKNMRHPQKPRISSSSSSFGSSSWSKLQPSSVSRGAQSPQPTIVTRSERAAASNNVVVSAGAGADAGADAADCDPAALEYAAECIAPIVAQQMHHHHGSDPVTSALVSTAAVTMSLSAMTTAMMMDSSDLATSTSTSEAAVAEEAAEEAKHSSSAPEPTTSFAALMRQKPLASLLDDFGEQDTDWQNMKVIAEPELPPQQVKQQQQQEQTNNSNEKDPTAATTTTSHSQEAAETPTTCYPNRLERQGKAPIHVEFTSFGYRHGIPSELRTGSTGNSYAQPLPDLDCRRRVAPVPPYLNWMDGSSGAVRNALLRWRPNENDGDDNHHETWIHVRDFVRDSVVEPVARALTDAMGGGGHGYALPLRMTIFVGSQEGRHRSVVVAELAATALRKMLRNNDQNRFAASTVSVSTRHRDIDMQVQQQQNNRKNNGSNRAAGRARKQKEFEDD